MDPENNAGYRLSPIQKSAWLKEPEGPTSLIQAVVDIGTSPNSSSVARSLEKVVDRHETLRTHFRKPTGMKLPLQVIAPTHPVVIDEIDLAKEPGGELTSLLTRETRPFDLFKSPPWRVSLVRQSNGQGLLVFTASALIADAESLRCLAREISQFLAGGQTASDIPPEPLQYADFSEWLNEKTESGGEEAKAGGAYWQERGLTSVPPLTLPFESSHRTTGTTESGRVEIRWAKEVNALVAKVSRDLGVDAESIFFAAWQALLGRLTGQDEFLVDAVYSGRPYEEARGAVGRFAQALPMHCRVPDMAFSESVRQSSRDLANSRRWHEHLPESIPHASVAFAFEAGPTSFSAGPGTLLLRRLHSRLHAYSLQFSCLWADGRPEAEISYDARLFEADDIVRLGRAFERLVENALRRPETPVGIIDLLSQTERDQILSAWNQTRVDYPKTRCLHQLFEEQVALGPQRPALADSTKRWTYGELNAEANRLACYLRKQGVVAGAPVGLCLERSGEAVLALLAILKAGGAYVPLQPEHPQARLAHQLAETQASVLITQTKLLQNLPQFAGKVICLDRDQARFQGESSANLDCVNRPEDLVYVMYTSGSTGTPKGVGVRHQNLVNYACFIRDRLGLDASAKNTPGLHFATVSTLSADLGNTCVFPALITGGCLHVIDYDTAMDSRRFAAYTAVNPIDVLKITPSHLGALMATPEGQGVLPSKFLLLGGEAFTWELARRIRPLGTCAILNHYGPTETTVGSLTFGPLNLDNPLPHSATVPIGRPIANTTAYILDSARKPIPVGFPGELFLGGAGVAAGYLNQPAQTSERFVADPFQSLPQARMYRTGDRVRWLPSGDIEFLGRADQQVKIRGFRVEPGEIEAILCRHPGIRQGVVVASDGEGGKRLVGYVVAAPGRNPTTDELRDFLGKELPDYMIPGQIVFLDAMPLTANGKVDRGALPDPASASLSGPDNFVGPRNPIETGVAEIWAEILGVARIGVNDDFFALGGHSLLATQVVSRVRRAFNVELPLRSMFETPTVAGLAQTIAASPDQANQESEMNRMLADLEAMSEEEVQRLLALESNPE